MCHLSIKGLQVSVCVWAGSATELDGSCCDAIAVMDAEPNASWLRAEGGGKARKNDATATTRLPLSVYPKRFPLTRFAQFHNFKVITQI